MYSTCVGRNSLRSVAFSFALIFYVSGTVQAQDFVNLTDLVAGGDGTGLGGGAGGDREFWGLNQDTGLFLRQDEIVIAANGDTTGVNPVPVPDSDFIDRAFFIDETPLAINSGGVVVDWPIEDIPTNTPGGYGPIMSNFTVEFPSTTIEVAGQTDWTSVVTIHSAAGVTFDLAQLRATHGADKIKTLSTFVGEGACSCGGASAYIIYSDADGIIDDPAVEDSEFFRIEVSEGEGEAYLGDIPDDATYLTFATGAKDADFCCDTVGFAAPRILSDSEIDPCAEFKVAPAEVAGLLSGGTAQLAATCISSIGFPTDVTTTGTTYASDDEAVATVDANGLITARASGSAQITVTNGDKSVVVPVTVPGAVIDLGDIVAGGDGTGLGGGPNGDRDFWSLDQDTGQFLTEEETGLGARSDQDGVNPVPVVESDFINVAFFIDETPLPINSEGVMVDFPVADIPTDTGTADGTGGYGPIFSNVTGALPETTITVAGVSSWSTCVGIHSAAGVTFDLETLRAEHGAENVHTFSTVAGESACTCNSVNMYIIYSNSDGIVDDPAVAGAYFAAEIVGEDAAERYIGQIPAEAEFLTLATGARDTQFCCDAATFAEARILAASEVQQNCQELVSDDQLILGSGLSDTLSVWCIDGLGIRRNVTAGATGTVYGVAPEGIVTVSEDGLVAAVGMGAAEITAMHNGLMTVTAVTVEGALCESISIFPVASLLRVGDSKQLTATCLDALGNERDVPIVYSVDPEGVVTVDENGLMTAVADGEARISADNAGVVGTANVVVQSNFLELSDLVAGGDGTGLGGGAGGDRDFWGLDQDTGNFLREDEIVIAANGSTNGVNPVPVPDSDFIDVAFFIDETPLAINDEGGAVDWPIEDIPTNTAGGFGPIMSNFTVEFPNTRIEIAGQTDWETVITIHSAAGVTFDLEALRGEHGADQVHTLSVFVGEGACSCAGASAYIIYSDADGIIDDPSNEDSPFFRIEVQEGEGEAYLAEIPEEAQYLTFATGALDADFCCDTVGFAEARILADTGGGPEFVRGDCNDDGKVDIADAVCILNWLFAGGGDPGCIAATNTNGDEAANITDATYLLNHLFSGSDAPVAPHPDCGPGALDADATLGCVTPPAPCR